MDSDVQSEGRREQERFQKTLASLSGEREFSAERQNSRGKLSALERVEKLLDPGSFEELDAFVQHRSQRFGMERRKPYGDGVITGFGTIHGRKVAVFSHDFTTFRRLARRRPLRAR